MLTTPYFIYSDDRVLSQVPSNYITKLVGEDLMEFHQSMVVGATGTMGEVADEGWSTSVPQVKPCGHISNIVVY